MTEAGAGTRSRKPRLLFFVTEDWYFCSHRLPLAVAAREAGFEVLLATRIHQHEALISAAGIRIIPLDLDRGSRNPLGDWRTLLTVYRVMRQVRPDLIHNVALKPVLYGSLLARLAGLQNVINAVAGLGHLFAEPARAKGTRQLVLLALKKLLRGRGRVIVQNPDDLRLLETCGALEPGQAVLIPGAGVDLDQFRPEPEPAGTPVVLMASRMLWDKGVGEFVEAARLLRRSGMEARFVLVGAPDAENPGAIPESTLADWVEKGDIEWWGHQADMPRILNCASLFCLPSYYGEGIPKVLIEAAACGRALITTDMPGCREVVEAGAEGLRIPPRDARALAEAIQSLLENPSRRKAMGNRARLKAEARFGLKAVTNATLDLYRAMLEQSPTRHD